MKKTFLLKLLSLILILCAVFTLFSACGGSSSSNDDEDKTSTKCSHEYADEYTCHDRECLECGKVKKATTEHTFADNFTCHDRECECGYIEQATTEHEYENGYCDCGDHTHVFNEQIVTSDFLDKAATCEKKATYFYSCTCGEKGSETFEYGDFANHEYTELKRDENIHWYECKCGYWDGSLAEHFYVTKHDEYMHWGECMCGQIGIEEEHKGGTATCTQLATCSECYVEYGELGDHKFENGFCECGEIDENYIDPNLIFTLINNDIEYEVSDYTGTATKLCIPSVYDNKPVTSLGENAFEDCISLVEIEIPDSITNIGVSAFRGCNSLTYNEKYRSKYLGNSNNPYLYFAEAEDTHITSVNIDINCKLIGYSAFSGCHSLTSIEIPESVINIGDYAFRVCRSLTSIEIPESVISIGDYAFLGCSSLTDIEIPDSIISIGREAFSGSSLIEIVIPDSVTNIGFGAFNSCRSLTNIIVDINNSEYKSIDGNLYSKDGKTLMEYARGKSDSSFIIPEDVTNIRDYAFSSSDFIINIIIHNDVTNIGDYAFKWCVALTIYCETESKPSDWSSSWAGGCPVVWDCNNNDIAYDGGFYTVVDGVRYRLGGFYGVARQPLNITEANIKSSVIDHRGISFNMEWILSDAFGACDSLISVVIPDSITNIGHGAFSNCNSLTSIIIPDSVTYIDGDAFSGCEALTIYCEAESKPSGWNNDWNSDNIPVVWDCNNNDIADDGNIYTVVDGVRYALKDDTATVIRQPYNITEAVIKSSINYKGVNYSVTNIEGGAFNGCKYLTRAVIPNISVIGRYAFYGCYSLTIYCKYETTGYWWNYDWNPSNCPVVWGYKGN